MGGHVEGLHRVPGDPGGYRRQPVTVSRTSHRPRPKTPRPGRDVDEEVPGSTDRHPGEPPANEDPEQAPPPRWASTQRTSSNGQGQEARRLRPERSAIATPASTDLARPSRPARRTPRSTTSAATTRSLSGAGACRATTVSVGKRSAPNDASGAQPDPTGRAVDREHRRRRARRLDQPDEANRSGEEHRRALEDLRIGREVVEPRVGHAGDGADLLCWIQKSARVRWYVRASYSVGGVNSASASRYPQLDRGRPLPSTATAGSPSSSRTDGDAGPAAVADGRTAATHTAAATGSPRRQPGTSRACTRRRRTGNG